MRLKIGWEGACLLAIHELQEHLGHFRRAFQHVQIRDGYDPELGGRTTRDIAKRSSCPWGFLMVRKKKMSPMAPEKARQNHVANLVDCLRRGAKPICEIPEGQK